MAGPFGIPTFENFDFSAYGKAGFGAEDLAYLQSQGASPYMINQVAQQAMSKGLNIGKVVQDYLVANPMVSANPFAPKPSSPAYSLTDITTVPGVTPKRDVGSYTVPQKTYTFDPSKYKPTATAPAAASASDSASDSASGPTTLPVGSTPEPKGPTMADVASDFAKQIAEMQTGLVQSLQSQSEQFAEIQAAQTQRMSDLQEQMLQAQLQSAQRPSVAGVKTAPSTAGSAMQIARLGATGAFGRGGMRISSLNV